MLVSRLLSQDSPSGEMKAVVRECSIKGEEKQFLEVSHCEYNSGFAAERVFHMYFIHTDAQESVKHIEVCGSLMLMLCFCLDVWIPSCYISVGLSFNIEIYFNFNKEIYLILNQLLPTV